LRKVANKQKDKQVNNDGNTTFFGGGNNTIVQSNSR